MKLFYYLSVTFVTLLTSLSCRGQVADAVTIFGGIDRIPTAI
jgi:hypothetical protein